MPVELAALELSGFCWLTHAQKFGSLQGQLGALDTSAPAALVPLYLPRAAWHCGLTRVAAAADLFDCPLLSLNNSCSAQFNLPGYPCLQRDSKSQPPAPAHASC